MLGKEGVWGVEREEKQPIFAMSVTLDYRGKCTYKNVCIFSDHSQRCLNMALILC